MELNLSPETNVHLVLLAQAEHLSMSVKLQETNVHLVLLAQAELSVKLQDERLRDL